MQGQPQIPWASLFPSPCLPPSRMGGLPNSGINTSINNSYNYMPSQNPMQSPSGGYTRFYGLPAVPNNHQKQKGVSQGRLQTLQKPNSRRMLSSTRAQQQHMMAQLPSPGRINPTFSRHRNHRMQHPSLVESVQDMNGNIVYVCNKGVVVGKRKKRYIRLRWGDGTKGHKARWVGFAPTSWTFKQNRPVPHDPLLLGFFVKPNLCENRAKSKKPGTGWVTLSIDCDRRAVKATLDGWTLGKVYIPTWLLGRVMRPVAVAEAGVHVTFDLKTESGCEKVLRAGFRPWDSICDTELQKLRCSRTGVNFVSGVLGMNLHVCLDQHSNVIQVLGLDSGYVSYSAIEAGLVKPNQEVIPLVINDHHAYRVKERKLWELFYADERVPLDYLSERMNALVLKIHFAKQHREKALFNNCLTKLCHLRHILYYLAKENYEVIADANARVKWFMGNTHDSGSHRFFTPDLGKLLVCLAVSDYELEDIAIPFFLETLHRTIPFAVKLQKNFGSRDAGLSEMFKSVMASGKISTMALYVQIFVKILKPNFEDLDSVTLERLSAEELCCGVAGLSKEFQVIEYERSSRKDEIKKSIIRRDWEHDFSPSQWGIIQEVFDDPLRLRAMLSRARMMSLLHGTCGLPTHEMKQDIDNAFERASNVKDWKGLLNIFHIGYPGDAKMKELMWRCIKMSKLKQYLSQSFSEPAAYDNVESACARELLSLNQGPRGLELLRRQGREPTVWSKEVLPTDLTTKKEESPPPAEVTSPDPTKKPSKPERFSFPLSPQAEEFSPASSKKNPKNKDDQGQLNENQRFAPATYLFNPSAYPVVMPSAVNNSFVGSSQVAPQISFPVPSYQVEPTKPSDDSTAEKKENETPEVIVLGGENKEDSTKADVKVPDVDKLEEARECTPRSKLLGKFSFARTLIDTTDEKEKTHKDESILSFSAHDNESNDKVLEFKLGKIEEKKGDRKPQTFQSSAEEGVFEY